MARPWARVCDDRARRSGCGERLGLANSVAKGGTRGRVLGRSGIPERRSEVGLEAPEQVAREQLVDAVAAEILADRGLTDAGEALGRAPEHRRGEPDAEVEDGHHRSLGQGRREPVRRGDVVLDVADRDVGGHPRNPDRRVKRPLVGLGRGGRHGDDDLLWWLAAVLVEDLSHHEGEGRRGTILGHDLARRARDGLTVQSFRFAARMAQSGLATAASAAARPATMTPREITSTEGTVARPPTSRAVAVPSGAAVAAAVSAAP